MSHRRENYEQIVNFEEAQTVYFPLGTPPEEVTVLVVGAGPSGLGTALELNGHGVSVAVIDRGDRASLGRAGAVGFSQRSVQHFRRWDVLQAVRHTWTVPLEWNRRGFRRATSLVGHDLVPSRTVGVEGQRGLGAGIRRPQTVLQKVFIAKLEQRGVTVSGNWNLVHIDDTGDSVVSTITHAESGESRTIRSQYVIGADGNRSTVRELSGITRSGDRATTKQHRLIVRAKGVAEYLGTPPSGANFVYNAVYTGFISAVSPTDWIINSAGPYPLDYEPSEDELLRIARAAFGVHLDLEIIHNTVYYRSTRVADQFRKGRVLLVGDAAHVRTPGGNLSNGFADIANLGWKLASVLRGVAGESLLDSYDEERRPHNFRIGENAKRRVEASEVLHERIRDLGVPDDDDSSEQAERRRVEVRELLAAAGAPGGAGVSLDERYENSSTIWYLAEQQEQPWHPDRYEPSGLPGHLAPNEVIDPYDDTLYDLIANDLTLINFSQSGEVTERFESAARELGLRLRVAHLVDEELQAIYGANNVLVRPDHHVVWRGDELDVEAGEVLNHILGRARDPRVVTVAEQQAARASLAAV